MAKTCMFDVFDTLLIRKDGNPDTLHYKTALRARNELRLNIEPEVFANARIAIEKKITAKSGIRPDIYIIYKKLSEELDISESSLNKILETEIENEFDNVVPVNKNIELLKNLRDDGNRVCYVFNSGLNQDFIIKLLTATGVYRKDEKVFSACGITAENSEEIVRSIENEMGLNAGELHYYGNNSILLSIVNGHNDGENSTSQRLKLNRYENYLVEIGNKYKLSPKTAIKYSAIAGASRYSRLQIENEKESIYDVAASVTAPVLSNFVTYVLEKSTGKTIYFLARDGYILHRIAEKINKDNRYNVELKYLYMSREVLVLARLDEMSYDKYVEYLKKVFSIDKLSYLFDLFSIDENDLKDLDFETKQKDQKISSLKSEYFHIIFNEKEIKEKVIRESRNRKKRVVAYLEQEGLLSSEPITIVDSGWYLTIHNILAGFMKRMGKNPPEGFYFGINEPAGSSLTNGKKHGYFWDFRKGHSHLTSNRSGLLLEVFCSAPHGRTIDYEITGKSIKPVLDNHEMRYLLTWGVNDLINGILNTVDAMLKNNIDLTPNKIDPEIFYGLLNLLWKKPTREEVRVWGEYPFGLSRDGKHLLTLHKRESFFKTIKNILIKGKLPSEEFDFWPYAHMNFRSDIENSILKYSLRIKRKIHFLRQNEN
jgi:hypothetical protein